MKFREFVFYCSFWMHLFTGFSNAAAARLLQLCFTTSALSWSKRWHLPFTDFFWVLICLSPCGHPEPQHKSRHLDVAEEVDYGRLEKVYCTSYNVLFTCSPADGEEIKTTYVSEEINDLGPMSKRWYPSLQPHSWKQPETH